VSDASPRNSRLHVFDPIRFLIPDAVAKRSAEIDACSNVKYVGRLTATVGAGRDTRPSTKRAHEALHAKPGHEHLD
jgi:hypothetical protein